MKMFRSRNHQSHQRQRSHGYKAFSFSSRGNPSFTCANLTLGILTQRRAFPKCRVDSAVGDIQGPCSFGQCRNSGQGQLVKFIGAVVYESARVCLCVRSIGTTYVAYPRAKFTVTHVHGAMALFDGESALRGKRLTQTSQKMPRNRSLERNQLCSRRGPKGARLSR